MEKHKTILHGPTHFFKNLVAKDWKTLRGMLLAGEKERNIYRGNTPTLSCFSMDQGQLNHVSEVPALDSGSASDSARDTPYTSKV